MKPSYLLAVAISLLTLGALTSSAWAQSTIDPALAFTLSSPANITLGANSAVSGNPVGAIGKMTIGSRATVSSDADALGKLVLRNRAIVGGTCASLIQPKVPKSASCNMTEVGPGSALVPLNLIPTSGVTFCPAAGSSQTALNLKRGASQTLSALSGTQVFDFPSIKLGRSSVLTISGPSDAVVIIDDSGIFKMAKNAVITFTGGIPVSNILILVGSTGATARQPDVTIGAATVNATLFSAGACTLGAGATMVGQMYCGGNVKVGRGATISGSLLSASAADAVTCP